VADVTEFFGLDGPGGAEAHAHPIKVMPVCAYTGAGLKESLEWLVHAVRASPRAQRLRVMSSAA